jgi:hypothetical protein
MGLILGEFPRTNWKNHVLHRMLVFEIAKCEMFWRKRNSKSMSADSSAFSRTRQDVSLILVGFWENAEKAE